MVTVLMSVFMLILGCGFVLDIFLLVMAILSDWEEYNRR